MNRVVYCPKCGKPLQVPEEIQIDDFFICSCCSNEFANPNKVIRKKPPHLFNVDFSISKNQGYWLIAVVVIILAVIGVLSKNNQSNSTVQNNAFDGSVYQVEQYLKSNFLKDPDSYKGIEWSKVNEVSGESYKYWVRHRYRAKNSFGGYVTEDKIFYLNADGDVIGVDL